MGSYLIFAGPKDPQAVQGQVSRTVLGSIDELEADDDAARPILGGSNGSTRPSKRSNGPR
jgi:hypothetical protein